MGNDVVLENLVITKHLKNGIIADEHGNLYKVVSPSSPRAKVLENNDDEMEIIIECPYCQQPTRYGDTRMSSGHVGCDNKLTNGRVCYDEVRDLDIERHKHYGE